MTIGAILVGIGAGLVTLAVVLRPFLRSGAAAAARLGPDELIECWVAQVRAETPAGAAEARPIVCARCGHALTSGDNFCSRCGAPLGSEA